MRRTWLAVLLLPLFVVTIATVRAGDKTDDVPSVVVRVKSLNALLQNLNLVVKLVGQEEAANQIEGLIKSKIGKTGINGIDPARPIGAYVRYGKEIDALSGAVLIPVADQASILTLLDNLGVSYKKDKDGVYTHKTNQNVDVYFRFAHQYLYITSVNADSIQQKNLPDPAKALAMSGDATISVLARVDRIPADARQIALFKLEETIQEAKVKDLPNETPTQKAFRIAILDDLHRMAKNVINQASDVRLDIDVNDKSKELAVNLSITGKPGSELAKSIQDLGNIKSPLAGMVKKDLAFQGAFHFKLTGAMQKAFESVLSEATARSLEGIQDATKKKQAEMLFDSMMPTAKAGEYQLVLALLGPQTDRYTFVGALKLKDGVKLGATVHNLISDALKQIPEAERGKIQLDYAEVGSVKIHRFETPKTPALDALIDDVIGDKYLYVAFREDALFVALGKEALPTLRKVLARTDSAASAPLMVDIDVARLAKWLAHTPKQKDHASKFIAGGENSRVMLSLEGGTTLRASVRTHFNVLEFLVKTASEKQK